MIAQEKLSRLMELYFQSLEWRLAKPIEIIPKKAEVIEKTELGNVLGYNGIVSESGRVFTHNGGAQRTVFKPEQLEIDRERFYLEIKGYGFNGRHLHACHHSEGDLHFGMYFENAKREYDFLELASGIEGVRSQRPVALMRFSEEEFLYQSLRTLADHLLDRPSLRDKHREARRQNTIERFGRTEEEVARNMLEFYRKYGRKEVIKHFMPIRWHVNDSFLKEFGTITKPAGYLVRLARTPFRLSDAILSPKWPEMACVTRSELEETAFEAGRTYRELLDRGILHHVPGVINITLAGELMDFEDVCLMTDHEEIRRTWEFQAGQFSRREDEEREDVSTFGQYLALTLGHHYLDDYSGPFLEGSELGRTPEEAAGKIMDMHREEFGDLVNLQISPHLNLSSSPKF